MGRAADLAERIRKCFEEQDWSTLGTLYHEDAVQEWPQPGERFVGRDNILAVAKNYPALPEIKGFRVVAEADNLAVTELMLDYGGRLNHAIGITEVDDGKIRKRTEYWNEPFEAPESRAQWAQRM
jgi:ketosteroid isomerase-like protein